MEVIKIAILGVCAVVLGILLKGTKPEYSLYLSLAAGILILGYSVGKLQYMLENIKAMKEMVSIDSTYVNTLMKIMGITYIGEFSSSLCKDCGYSMIAGQIELFSKLSILVISLPVLMALLQTIQGFFL